ncbi:MAG: hypothetical protein ABW252_25560 [Polyangiales bacterium]
MTRPRPSTVPPNERGEEPRDDAPERYDLGELELAHWPPAGASQPSDGPLDELGALPPSRPDNDVDRPRTPAPPKHASGARELHADLDDNLAGPTIELDVPTGHSGMRLHSHPSLPSSSSRPPRTPSSKRPSGRADDGGRAARALAGYGTPPSGLIASAGYVIRVAKRMRILREERRVTEQRARAEADAHDQALAALGAVLMREPSLAGHSGLEEARARVQAHALELQQRTAAAESSRDADKSTLTELGARRKALEVELAPFLAAERAAASAQVRSEAELKRKRAQEQRLDIELRALERASVPAPPDRRAQIEQERRTRADETATHLRAHEETTRALGLARRELSLRRGHLDALEREQSQRQMRARKLDARLEDDVTRARHALDAQRCALAEAARALGLTSDSSDEVAQVAASEQRLDELVARLATYDRALDMYDLGGLVKGAMVWLALLLAGVLATWLITTPA